MKSIWLLLIAVLKSEGSLQCLQKLIFEPIGGHERMFEVMMTKISKCDFIWMFFYLVRRLSLHFCIIVFDVFPYVCKILNMYSRNFCKQETISRECDIQKSI